MNSEYRVDRDEALRYLGYRGQEVTDELLARMDAVMGRCEEMLRPDGRFSVHPIAREERRGVPAIVLGGTNLVFEGEDICAHLEGAKEAAVMAVTLGARSEMELQRLSATDPLEAVVFDAACSSLVEVVADAWEDRIVHEALERGLVTNWRYSPGYGDFPLDAQPAIVRALRADTALGLTVTDSCFLVPSKSVTAVIGLFEQDPGRKPEVPCARCKLRATCEMRKRGVVCHGRTR